MKAWIFWGASLWLFSVSGLPAHAAEARILKVLPHLVDEQGRISVAPGLFERDAYQRQLRENPKRIAGLRYDVQWEASDVHEDRLTIRLYLRTAKQDPGQHIIIEANVKDNRRLGGWSSVQLGGETYRNAGEVLAWRAVLLNGDEEIAEQKSFLW